MITNEIKLCDLEPAKEHLHDWEWATDSALEIEHRIEGAKTVLDQMKEGEILMNYPSLCIWPIGLDHPFFEIDLETALSIQLSHAGDWPPEDLELVAKSLLNFADKFQYAAGIARTAGEQKQQTIQGVGK